MKFQALFCILFFLSSSLCYISEIQTTTACNNNAISTEQGSTYYIIVTIGLKNGGWVLCWIGPNFELFFDLYSSNGVKIVSAKNFQTIPDPVNPPEKELKGCGTSTGGFVISYKTGAQGLRASFFDSAGNVLNADVTITTTANVGYHSNLCSSDGTVWFGYSPQGTMYLRSADSQGNLNSEITGENSFNVQITALAEAPSGGVYGLLYKEVDGDKNVFLKAWDSTGTEISPLQQVSQGESSLPSVCTLGDGNVVMLYANNPNSQGLFRIYNGTTPVTSQAAATSDTGDNFVRIFCSALGTDKFAVVFAQYYARTVGKVVFWNNGTEFLAESTYPTSADRSFPSIHTMANGNLMISYSYTATSGVNYDRNSWQYDTNLNIVNPGACSSGGFNCDSSSGFCAGCLDGKLFANETCLSVCPDGLATNNTEKFCTNTPCPQNCSGCLTPGICITCYPGYGLLNGICLSNANCPASCDTCSNATYCSTCKASFYLNLDNTCESTCPLNQYANSTSRTCTACTGSELMLIQGKCMLKSTLSPITGGTIICTSSSNCGKYINQNPYIFTVTHPQVSNYSAFDYYWTVSELSSLNLAQGIGSNLYIIANNHDLIGAGITINLVMYNWTNTISLTATVPKNTPPTGGQLTVNTYSGQALTTNFMFTTSGWTDTDVPLVYTFYYISSGVSIPIGPSGSNTTVSLVLPGNEINSQTVYCFATDVYGASSTLINVTVEITSPSNPLDNIQLVETLISGLNPEKPEENMRTLIVASSQLSNVNQLVSTDNPCTNSCSGHGTCLGGDVCVCNDGWSLDDCSLAKEKYEQVIAQKKQIFTLMGDYLKLLSAAEYNTTVLAAYDEGTVQSDFNDRQILNIVIDVLENILDITNPNTILTVGQANSVANILNNMLVIQGKRDCFLRDNFTVALENRTNSYLEAFSRNSLRDTAPIQASQKNLNFQFDLLTKSLGLCDINNYEIQTSTDGPIVTLLYPETNLNCKRIITVRYYVFRPNIFVCKTNESQIADPTKDKTKSLIAIGLKEEGIPINLPIKVLIRMPGSVLCPQDCETDPITKNCMCQSLDPFDIKGQISRIFSASKLSLLKNFGVLLSFKYWEHAFFWLLLAYCAWYIITMYLVWTKLKQYNVVNKFTKKIYNNWGDAFYTIFITKNPMFSPCFYEDEKLAKMVRVTLYFSRGMLILAYNSIFSNVALTKDGQYYFSIYLILLPYITYIPIIAIISVFLKIEPGKKLTTGLKIKIGIGSFVTLAILIACFFIILILGAQSTSDERKIFIINFIITILQDLIVNPAVGSVISFILYLIYTRGIKPLQKALSHPKIKKGIKDAIGKDAFEIAVK